MISQELHNQLLRIATEIQTIAENIGITDIDFDLSLKQVVELSRLPETEENKAKIEDLKRERITTEALEPVFEQKKYSDAQIQAIEDAASPTLFCVIREDGLPHALASAYTEPYNKIRGCPR